MKRNLSVCAWPVAAFTLLAGHAWGQCQSAKTEEAGCASLQASMAVMAPADIVDTAVAAGKFNTLAAALKAAGLVETLKGKGPFTVFAPTDDAFAKLPKGTVETLLKPENKDKLVSILTYHVVAGSWPASEVTKLSGATTVNGQRLDIKTGEGKVSIDGSTVIMPDVAASNGVIHAIDTVLMPADKDIVDTAAAAGKFTTLAAALKATGLDKALKGKGPFTVFAPTDDAFAKIPKETLASLMTPAGKDKLAAILKYHVVEGRVYSDAVVKMNSAKTLQGGSAAISVSDGVMVDDAKVIKTDLDASNGVVHVIDTVLMPKH